MSASTGCDVSNSSSDFNNFNCSAATGFDETNHCWTSPAPHPTSANRQTKCFQIDAATSTMNEVTGTTDCDTGSLSVYLLTESMMQQTGPISVPVAPCSNYSQFAAAFADNKVPPGGCYFSTSGNMAAGDISTQVSNPCSTCPSCSPTPAPAPAPAGTCQVKSPLPDGVTILTSAVSLGNGGTEIIGSGSTLNAGIYYCTQGNYYRKLTDSDPLLCEKPTACNSNTQAACTGSQSTSVLCDWTAS